MKTNKILGTAFAPVAILLTVGIVPIPLTAPLRLSSVLAQSAPAPSAAPNQTVKIDGSSSMKVTNETLTQQLKQRSPGADVQSTYNGTSTALQSVLKGETDLAAIGRPLTAQEKAQGLVLAPQKRQKIAILVGSKNPFTGDLTFEQFAKIFRGEITNWSQVGGRSAPIQLIDRPASNDTRQAFQSYPVFKQAPFVAAANAVKLSDNSTTAVINKLGTNGISYAIADSITNTPDVRIVPMHKTLPSDPRYPFSQPLAYAYRGPNPTPAAAAFLGIFTTAAIASPPAVVPAPASSIPASPETVAVTTAQTTETSEFPWWLLLIPPLGGLLWWLLKRSRPVPPIAAVTPKIVPIPPAAPVVPVAPVVPIAPVVPVVAAPVPNGRPPTIELHEERLIAEKARQKVGDVTINKRVDTEQVQASIPLEKERVIIERSAPTQAGSVVEDNVVFGVGETRVETYEEMADFHKEAFVHEEVNIAKQVDRETVTISDTLRHEELDIDMQRQPNIDAKYQPAPHNCSAKNSWMGLVKAKP